MAHVRRGEVWAKKKGEKHTVKKTMIKYMHGLCININHYIYDMYIYREGLFYFLKKERKKKKHKLRSILGRSGTLCETTRLLRVAAKQSVKTHIFFFGTWYSNRYH